MWIELQTAALPLGFFLITLTLYTYIDTVILGIMRTDAETGWYAASYRVYEGLMYAPSALATLLTPRFSQMFVDDRHGLRALFRRSLLGSAAMAVVIGGVAVVIARPMMLLFYGARLRGGGAAAASARGRIDFRVLHVDSALGSDRHEPRPPPAWLTTAIGLTANIALNIAIDPASAASPARHGRRSIAEAVTVTSPLRAGGTPAARIGAAGLR